MQREQSKDPIDKVRNYITGWKDALHSSPHDIKLSHVLDDILTDLKGARPGDIEILLPVLVKLEQLNFDISYGVSLFSKPKNQSLRQYLEYYGGHVFNEDTSLFSPQPIITAPAAAASASSSSSSSTSSSSTTLTNTDSNSASASKSVDPVMTATTAPAVRFTPKDCEMFAAIYNTIYAAAIAWTYSFPLAQGQQVMTDEIGTWQAFMMKPIDPGDALTAHADFKRDITIGGVKGDSAETAEVITARLQGLVDRAQYKPDEQALILSWLQARGGQATFSYGPREILLGALGRTFDMTPAVGTCNWDVSSDGRVRFTCQQYYKELKDGGKQEFLVRKKNGESAIYAEANYDEVHALKKNKGLAPLLSFKTTVTLGIDVDRAGNKQVKPMVTDFRLVSYTNALEKPGQKSVLSAIFKRK